MGVILDIGNSRVVILIAGSPASAYLASSIEGSSWGKFSR